MTESDIIIRGAREHNLRDVSLTLPRNKLIVMTGVSGSGKSSLAFDTLYAEGQRRYVESLSSYARQFLGQMPKPEVDSITGLAPSISIQQKTRGRNPRSTVGTITELYDYLRVLFARVGTGRCPKCGKAIAAQSTEQIIGAIASLPGGTRFQILAPLVQNQKGEYRDLFEDLLKRGFLRARVDGRVVQLSDDLQLDRQMKHTIEAVVDRLVAGKTGRSRLAEAVENALRLSGGTLIVAEDTPNAPGTSDADAQTIDRLYSSHYSCTKCGLGFEEPGPQLFSFNSPLGMCLDCNGLGMRHDFAVEQLIPKPTKTIAKGAIELLGSLRKIGRWRRHIYNGAANAIESDLGLTAGSLFKTPWKELSEQARHLFLFGTGDRHITFSWGYSGGIWKHGGTWEGIIPELLESYRKTNNPMRRKQLEKYMKFIECLGCGGARLNEQARSVEIRSLSFPTNGRRRAKPKPVAMSLPEVCGLSIADAAKFFEELDLDETGRFISDEALKEIRGRLGFLLKCGLDYLTLDRTAPTLSGGESQRIRLAGQIGCGLVGVVYILDEPSIGLHPRDNQMLLESLQDLRDQGNTVIVVEHDEETMHAADHIVDFGPGPGVRGGEIVVAGSLNQVKTTKCSVTGQFLSGGRSIKVPQQRRSQKKKQIRIKGASHNNLQDIDVVFPLESFVCVTGVSGSGKSSLVSDILWPVLNRDVNSGKGDPGRHKGVTGLKYIDKAIDIDQTAIGRTPRSNPATYVKLLDEIRSLYTKLPESRVRGYKPGRFSFNVAGGRCDACEGYGANKLEMDFLADIWVTCAVCRGRRFNHETLEVMFKDRSIADVLDMDVQEALSHFEKQPKIFKLLSTLHEVGLDYMKLGQPSPTLSGGEAQRIKLARELGKRSTGQTVYLLDEPTTGLHFADVEKLLEVLHNFVDSGNTVIVVEHNLDVIKTADWVIDLGPEGGAGGGMIVAEGTPEDIARCRQSYTGSALADVLPAVRRRKKKAKQSAAKTSRKPANGSAKNIVVTGAAQHNLQNLDIEIPRNRMSVLCGPSGSGKTSLAMDTLYAEGQRRYVESLSAYARQFLGQMPKPRVEHIHGLSPSIAIEQKTIGTTPRSTVGTVTEIYDYLRILFARLGQPYCPDCDVPVETQTVDEVVDRILGRGEGTRLLLLAPQEVEVGKSYDGLWDRLRTNGFARVRIDGKVHRLEEVPEIDRRRRHQVEVVVDRVSVKRRQRSRLAESVEAAFELGAGVLRTALVDESRPETDWELSTYSLHFACQVCGRSFEELTPNNFSFNSWLGWCEACEGLGTQQGTELNLLIDDSGRTLLDGAIAAWPDPKTAGVFREMLQALGDELRIPLDVAFRRLSPAQQRIILYGSGERWFTLNASSNTPMSYAFQYKGLYPAIEEAARLSHPYRRLLRDHVGEVPCLACAGSRLRDDAAAMRFNEVTIGQVCDMPLDEALAFLKGVKLNASQKKVAGDLLAEATSRLSFLVEVGLTYLTLSRTLPTLSGGEMQRIRLAGQIGRALTGVLYVLDEPTIGLHPRDNNRLLGALRRLRNLGNTLVLVEHDREVINASDRLYDFGPGAGRFGGTIVGDGTPKQLAKKRTLTGDYLSNRRQIAIPSTRRIQQAESSSKKSGTKNDRIQRLTSIWSDPPGGGWLELLGARQHNLQNVDLRIPLGTLTCVTGVSGSGKSSLIEDTLARAVAHKLHRASDKPGPYEKLLGIEQINKIIVVDQQPLGTTPASNPATYTGVFDHVRDLFSRVPDARVRGYRPARFSFNRQGGRCDDCEGNGQKCIEMHFLPDVWVTCETCRGRRYNEETLAVRFRGQSIADVLEMSVGQALELFGNIPKIRRYLATLAAVGLDYLTLGQSAPTLSGGEAQRVKLAAELARPNTGRTLYVLDEPTTGLHFDDIDKLLNVLNSLVEQGNTVIVIEHNLDVIKTADWIVDIGPEAGRDGGHVVAEGTPETIVAELPKTTSQRASRSKTARSKSGGFESHTAKALAPLIQSGKRSDRSVFDAAAAAEKQEGDLDLAQVGKETNMPWQSNGRQWHTVDRLAHNGQQCRWDGQALAHVIDTLADVDELSAAKWNDRSIVEVAGPKKIDGWFLHAATADEWRMTLRFRVKRNTFKQESLRTQLGLKRFDEIDELPVYDRSNRVRVRNLKGPWQEITVKVHSLDDVETPGFRKFLAAASKSFVDHVTREVQKPSDLMPWKVLKEKWHTSRKGFPSNKRVKWDGKLVLDVVNALSRAIPDAQVDWTGKQVVKIGTPVAKRSAASVFTKRREGIDVTFAVDRVVALGQIADFGAEREVRITAKGVQEVRIRFTAKNQVSKAFTRFLAGQFDS